MAGKRGRIGNLCPHGNLLFVDDLRECLGIQFGAYDTSDDSILVDCKLADTAKVPLEVLLIGHDLDAELKSMKDHGIDLEKRFHYRGCVDTHVIVEDTGRGLPKGLSDLMARYKLAELEWSKPACKAGKWVFIGAHNAGNDAIATLKVAIARALDLTLR